MPSDRLRISSDNGLGGNDLQRRNVVYRGHRPPGRGPSLRISPLHQQAFLRRQGEGADLSAEQVEVFLKGFGCRRGCGGRRFRHDGFREWRLPRTAGNIRRWFHQEDRFREWCHRLRPRCGSFRRAAVGRGWIGDAARRHRIRGRFRHENRGEQCAGRGKRVGCGRACRKPREGWCRNNPSRCRPRRSLRHFRLRRYAHSCAAGVEHPVGRRLGCRCVDHEQQFRTGVQ